MAVTMVVCELTRAVGDLDITNAPAVATNAAGSPPFLFPNDGKTILICRGGAGACTLTFTGNVDEYGRAAAVFTFVIGIGLTAFVGPFSPQLWNNANGQVSFAATVGPAADVFVEAVRVTDSGLNGV